MRGATEVPSRESASAKQKTGAVDRLMERASVALAAMRYFEAERLWTRNAFIEAIDNRPFDIILADHVLPGFDGDAALALARER